MTRLKTLLLHERRQAAVVASLAFATALCTLMLIVRALYDGSSTHFGLQWNLFLAWLPMLGALVAYNLGKRYGRRAWPLILPFLGLWLLFFPNAPYILTDFIHLRPVGDVPLWYDLILVITYALTGVFLGLVSLYLMQSLVRRAFGAVTSWVFTLGVLAVTGFGVYLGRFPRWNSWDLLTDPITLAGGYLDAGEQSARLQPDVRVLNAVFALPRGHVLRVRVGDTPARRSGLD